MGPSHGAELAPLTWQQAGTRASGAPLLAVPLGSTEQHGPHLPLDTDTRIATALAAGLARRRDDVLVAPALPYGASGEHAGFPGTLSLGTAALEAVLVELVRSASDLCRGTVLVCGHGGNREAVDGAVLRLRAEGRRVLGWMASVPGGDAHAGRTETSLMLALRPALVRRSRALPGDPRPLAELMPRLRAVGVAGVSANGVLGDPSGAGAAEGERLLAALLDDLVRSVARWDR
ncbi:MAG TPA: mycofactocin biosynthesis peptidyl-dipeptidase MftE [Candidatus Dormibacteraeota bacterium]